MSKRRSTTRNESLERTRSKVLAWLAREKGERRFELFVETVDHAESREQGWIARRNLVRLAGDFRPGGTSVTVTFAQSD